MYLKNKKKLLIIIPSVIAVAYVIYCIFIFCLSNYEVPQRQIKEQTYYKYDPLSSVSFYIDGFRLVWRCISDNHDALLVVFTGFLFIVTALLVRYTKKLWLSSVELEREAKLTSERQAKEMQQSLAIAKTAADAAELNAKAVIDAERAHLFISINYSNLTEPLKKARMYDNTPSMNDDAVTAPRIEYVFTNYGKTVALLREVSHGIDWESKDGLKVHAPFSYRPLETIAPNEKSKIISCEFGNNFTFGDTREIVTKKRALLFFGNAIFLDAFNRRRGIKWDFRCSGSDFILTGYQEYDP